MRHQKERSSRGRRLAPKLSAITGRAVRGVLAAGPCALVFSSAASAASLHVTSLVPIRDDVVLPAHLIAPPERSRVAFKWSRWKGAAETAGWGSSVVVGVAKERDLIPVARLLNFTAIVRVPGLLAFQGDVPDGDAARLVARARADRRVRYVEPMQRGWRLDRLRNDPMLQAVDPATGTPYEWQFALSHVDTALNLVPRGVAVAVGVIDSGAADVPDLRGKVAERWYLPGETASGYDVTGHGTAVASLIAAPTDDGFGMAGFGGAAQIYAYNLRTPASDPSIAAAINWLVGRHVRIINLSLGRTGNTSFVVGDALNRAFQAGVLIVASAGNEGAASVGTPASYLQPPGGVPSYGLAVGASNRDGSIASFSNYGASLSLLAPGKDRSGSCGGVFAAIPDPAPDFDTSCGQQFTGPSGASYAYVSGTSFASPEVAGVAALVWATRPQLLNYEVAEIIKQSATRPAGAGWNAQVGWGVLNAAAALELATGASSADRLAVYATVHAEAPAGSRVTFTGTARWADGFKLGSGTAFCGAAAGGSRLPAVISLFFNGTATCAVDVPPSAGGQTLNVTVSVTGEGASATGTASAQLIDETPPTARAFATAGRWGRRVSLRFSLSDETGFASATIEVLKNGRPVASFDRPLAAASVSAYTFAWLSPPKNRAVYSFCVTAADRSGNQSSDACATIKMR